MVVVFCEIAIVVSVGPVGVVGRGSVAGPPTVQQVVGVLVGGMRGLYAAPLIHTGPLATWPRVVVKVNGQQHGDGGVDKGNGGCREWGSGVY